MTGLFAILLFAFGLRLSAFYSGSETGFYRMSRPRLQIISEGTEWRPKWLLWFARHPSLFVATTLVGNNVANYLVTLSIGIGAAAVYPSGADVWEIALTLLLAPLIFVAGELLPKYLYYRAPMHFMRNDAPGHLISHILFSPLTLPLVGLTILLQKLDRSQDEAFGLLLGRNRLVTLLSRGHEEGLLTKTQIELVQGTLAAGQRPVLPIAEPVRRVFGLPIESDRKTIIAHARQYAMAHVPLYRGDPTDAWAGSVMIADLLLSRTYVREALTAMPEIAAETSLLEAILLLFESKSEFLVIRDSEGAVTHLVDRERLIKQFRIGSAG